MKRRAQSDGKGIAVLLLLLALFVVLYLLLLPPEERESLLNQTYGEETGEFSPKLLLSESPGEVNPTQSKSITHEFSPISLFIKTEPKTERLANSLEIYRSLFSSKPQILTFYIEDLTNVKDAYVFFNVLKGKGNLQIWLNDHILLDQKVSSVQSIELPVSYLRKQNNLVIKVSSPGVLFFLRNSYSLSDIIIKTSYRRLNPQEDRTFSISKSEKDNLQTADLKFSIYCNELAKDTAELNVYVNEKDLLSKQVFCSGSSEVIEIPTSIIQEGQNKLSFSISDGDFQFSKIKIETNLKESTYPQYHFDVKDEDYNFIKDGTAKAVFNLKMSEGNKKSAFILNGHEFVIDTSELNYNKIISDLIENGDNYIRIVPKSTFTIESLDIKLENV